MLLPYFKKTPLAPLYLRFAVGVDPVDVREDLRACAKKLLFSKVKGIKKVPNISGLNVGVDPDAIGRTPDPLLVRKKKKSFQIF